METPILLSLLTIPVVASALLQGFYWWLSAAGVLAAAAWWTFAYRDNVGASDVGSGAALVVLTGSFAFAYLLLWIAAIVAGRALGQLLRRVRRPT